jgi:hypothetical protein
VIAFHHVVRQAETERTTEQVLYARGHANTRYVGDELRQACRIVGRDKAPQPFHIGIRLGLVPGAIEQQRKSACGHGALQCKAMWLGEL